MKKLRIAENMKILRWNAGLTQQGMEKQLKIADSTISKWENGKKTNMTISSAIKIADFFGVTLDDLLYKKFKLKRDSDQ